MTRIHDDFDITVTRTEDRDEADQLMNELCEEIREHYGIVERIGWLHEPRTLHGFGKNEMGEELVKYRPPRYTVEVQVRRPEPPQYPLDPEKWVEILIHDINTSLPGFEAEDRRYVPPSGLRTSELSNYLGETYEPEVLSEKELHRRREDEDPEDDPR